MKTILLPGLVAGVAMLVAGLLIGFLMNAALPSLASEYQNTNLFRPWSDPIMSLYFIYPFFLGIALSWVWEKIKMAMPEATPLKKGMSLALSFWMVSSIPGILISYSSFPISLCMALTWLLSSLLQLIVAGWIYSMMKK